MRFATMAALGSACVWICVGCAADSSADGDSGGEGEEATSNAVVGGTVTTAHKAIGIVDLGGSFCTGTLVRSRAVITASHCIGYNGERAETGYAFKVDGAASSYPSDRVISFGVWSASNEPNWRARDVALVRLSKAVPSSVATPVGLAKVWPSNGGAMSFFGYGCTDRATQANAGTKRTVKLTFDDAWQSGDQGRDHLCPGDSGGPLLDASRGMIVGIASGYISGVDYFGDVPGLCQEIFDKMGEWGVTR